MRNISEKRERCLRIIGPNKIRILTLTNFIIVLFFPHDRFKSNFKIKSTTYKITILIPMVYLFHYIKLNI